MKIARTQYDARRTLIVPNSLTVRKAAMESVVLDIHRHPSIDPGYTHIFRLHASGRSKRETLLDADRKVSRFADHFENTYGFSLLDVSVVSNQLPASRGGKWQATIDVLYVVEMSRTVPASVHARARRAARPESPSGGSSRDAAMAYFAMADTSTLDI